GPPFRLPKLCVFTQFTDWRGEIELQVDVVRAANLEQAFFLPPLRIPVPSRTMLVHAPFSFCNFPFPTYGEYLVELFCNGEFVEDRRFHVLPSSSGASL